MVSSFVYVVSGKVHEWISRLNTFPRIPLIVIDGTGHFKMGPERKNCFFIRTSNREAGREVGRTLIEHGHRHVAFIPYECRQYEWETDREEGVREVYDAVGGEWHLTGFSQEQTDTQVPTARDLLGWAGTKIRVILCSSGILPFEAVHERIGPLEKLDRLPALMNKTRPAFDRAYRDRSITAWICANDEVAALAMHYLRGRGPNALNRISLVGFDNSPISYVMGISSYEFDFRSMARFALQAVAHPEVVRRSEGQVVTLRGHLVVRKSIMTIHRIVP
jgi:DNA-binding LacI/PurR family transcriptional regulator